MSDRTIIGGITRLAQMQVVAEKQLAQYRREFERFMAVQEDQLCQMRVALDDAAVMLGVIPRPGSEHDGEGQREGQRELPAGHPGNPGSGPQAVFTANGEGGGGNFQGADL